MMRNTHYSTTKRIYSLILALMMILQFVPTGAMADTTLRSGEESAEEYYIVSFYNRDAEKIEELNVAKGSAIGDQIPAVPSREDYNASWAEGQIVAGGQGNEIQVTGGTVTGSTVPAGDMTVVPSYTKISYTVTFYKNEEKTEKLTTKTVDADTNYCVNDIPAVPARDGYAARWVTDAGDFSNKVNIKADTDVWPVYTKNVFTVTYKVEGTTYQTDTYYTGDELQLPNAPVVEGKEFTGWYFEETKYTGGEAVTSDLVLTAAFSSDYYVKFVILNDDGTVAETLAQYFKTNGEEIQTLPQVPFVSGKVFEKWVNQDTGEEVTAETTVSASFTAVAVFRTLSVYDITAEYYYLNDRGAEVVFNRDLLQVEASELPYTIIAPASTKTDEQEVSGGPIYYPETPQVTVEEDDFENQACTVRFRYVKYTATYDFVYKLKDLTGDGYTEIPDSRIENVQGVLDSDVTPTVKTFDFAVLEKADTVRINQASGQELEVLYTRKSYQLSYETNGGSYVGGSTVLYGAQQAVTSTVPTKTGYTFDGWYTDEGLTQAAGSTVTVNGDTILYAKWKGDTVDYTIVYMFEKYNDTGTQSSFVYDNSRTGTGTVGTTVQAASAPTITRKGWEKDNTQNAASSVVIAADGSSVLFVYYKLVEYSFHFRPGKYYGYLDDYNVTASLNGQSRTGNNNYSYTFNAKLGQDISALWISAGNGTYRHGNVSFSGWTKVGGDTVYVTKRLTLTEDMLPNTGTSITYEGYWLTSTVTYTVNYMLQNADDDGYTRSEAYSQTYNYSSGSSLSPKDIAGYTYVRRTGSGNTTNFYYDRDTFKIDYYYGSSLLDTISNVKFDANINKSPYTWTPTAAQCGVDSDYTFRGWYADSGLNTPYTFSRMPASNVVLYAKWTAPSYTVSFVDADGTTQLADSQTVEKYRKVSAPETRPTKSGYIFEGWFTAADGNTLYDWNTQITADTTIYAHWTRNTLSYLVHYVDEAGDPVADDKSVINPNFEIGDTVTENAIAIAGYRPDAASKSIDLAANGNVITFVYSAKANMTKYTVRYIIADGETGAGTSVVPTKTVDNVPGNSASVIELAESIDYNALYTSHPELSDIEFYPDEVEKTLVLTADGDSNVLTFYYSSFKNAKVTVNFVDMNGSPIANADIQHLKVGKTFILSRTPIAGWEINKVVAGTAYADPEAGSSYKITEAIAQNGLTFTLFYQKKATITVVSNSKQYDGNALTLADGLNNQVTVEGLLNNHSLANIEYEYANTDNATNSGRINAGTATVTPKNAEIGGITPENTNYYKIRYISGTLEVTRINVTVRVEPDRWTGIIYDGELKKTGFTNPSKGVEDYIIISHEGYKAAYLNAIWAKINSQAIETGAAGLGYVMKSEKDVGDYSYNVTLTQADLPENDNYSVSIYIRSGRLQILPKEVTITTGTDTKVYDGTPLTKDEASISGLIEGETATVTATGSITDVGSAQNTYSIDWGTTNSNNYKIKANLGTLTVTPATLSVTVKGKTTTYDGTEQSGYTIDGTISGTGSTIATDDYLITGLASGDTLTITGYTTSSGTDAGTYENGSFAGATISITRGNEDITAFYSVTTTDGTLEISKRTVTLTSADGNKVYDGTALTKNAQTDVTVGGDGFATGEGATYDITGTQTEVGNSPNAFTYTLNEGTKAENYEITTTPGTLTVTELTDKVTVTITEHSGSEKYDGGEKTVTGYDVAIDNKLYTEADFTFSGDATVKGTDAGSYPMELKAADFTNTSKNFTNVEFVIVDGTLEISKRTVTLTSADGNKVYDGQPLTKNAQTDVTVGGDGFVTGEGATYDITGTQTDAGSSANAFTYTLNSNTKADNYTITKTEGTLIVTELTDTVTVTITEHSGSEKYDGGEKTVTGYDVAIDNKLYTEADFTFSGDATVKGTDAGSYPMELKAEGFTNNSKNFTNVEFVIVDGTLEISKRTVTLTSADGNKVYDGTALTKNAQTDVTVGGDGFATGEGATYSITGTQTDAGSSANAFTYTLNEGTKAENYEITTTPGTLTVTELTDKVTVTITEHSGSEKYDGGEKTVTGYDVAIDNKLYTEADFTFSGDATVKGTDAGSYPMELKAADFTNTSKNFTNVEFVIVDGTLEISKRTVTLTSADGNKVYDGTALTKNAQTDVTVGGDGFATGEGATYDITGTQTEVGNSPNAFTYTLNSNTKADNYTITKTEGTLTVTELTDKVTVTITEHSGSEKYDGGEKTVTGYDVAIDNKLYTEADFTFSGDATVKGTDAGSYPMELKATDFTNTSKNFTNVEFVIVDGTLEISKRTVTLTSADGNKVYDGTALTKNAQTDVTVGGDGFATGEGATYDITGTQTEVGNSPNAFTYTLNEGTKAGNYEITTTPGTLTVTAVTDKVTVTITEHSGSEKYDGGEKTVTGYDVAISNPLYKEADFTFSGDATVKGTDAGSYPMELKATDFTNTSKNFTNVEFVIVDGTLEISKRTVTLTSADGEKVYDGQPLTKNAQTDVTVGEDDFAEGEGATYDITGTQTDAGNSPNAFTYTLNEGTKAGNYEITTTPGTLTVTELTDTVTVTITEHSGSEKYDGSEKTATGYDVAIDNKLYTEADFTFSGDATVKGTDAGSYPMELKAADFTNNSKNITNVEFVIVDGTLEIAKRTVTLTSATDSKVYDETPLTNDKVTVTGDGFAEKEGAAYDVTGTQTLVGSNENAFTYTLNEGTKAANYEITTAFGTLTVTDGEGEDEEPVDPSLVVTKTAEEGPYALGDEVTFTITATNIYEAAQTITLSEIAGVTLARSSFENVAGGETITTTAAYTITEEDILNGSFTNTVTAKMGNITKTADAMVTTEDPNGHLTITKETTSEAAAEDGKYALNEKITYKITVLNDGNLTITDITVTDELTGDEWTIDSLAPDASEEFTAEYTVTEADILAGEVVNVATGKGTSPDPEEKEVPVEPGRDPEPTEEKNGHMTVTKTSTSKPANEAGYALGETIEYQIVVTNDGNLTMTNITVEDKLTGMNETIASLAPGQEETFTTTYVVTEQDVEAGSVVNEATATGIDPEDKEVPGEPGTDTEPVIRKYRLTVNYWMNQVGGERAANAFTAEYTAGAEYNVASPILAGFLADQERVTGTITTDTTVDVVYTMSEFTLTIYYVYADGTQAAPTYQRTLAFGEAYSVLSPVIDGYTANFRLVTGEMPARNMAYTIRYQAAGNGTIIDDYDTPLGLAGLGVCTGETYE